MLKGYFVFVFRFFIYFSMRKTRKDEGAIVICRIFFDKLKNTHK